MADRTFSLIYRPQPTVPSGNKPDDTKPNKSDTDDKDTTTQSSQTKTTSSSESCTKRSTVRDVYTIFYTTTVTSGTKKSVTQTHTLSTSTVTGGCGITASTTATTRTGSTSAHATPELVYDTDFESWPATPLPIDDGLGAAYQHILIVEASAYGTTLLNGTTTQMPKPTTFLTSTIANTSSAMAGTKPKPSMIAFTISSSPSSRVQSKTQQNQPQSKSEVIKSTKEATETKSQGPTATSPAASKATITCAESFGLNRFIGRDDMKSKIGTFCADATKQGTQDKGTESLVRPYDADSRWEIELSMKWPEGRNITENMESNCVDYMSQIMDGKQNFTLKRGLFRCSHSS